MEHVAAEQYDLRCKLDDLVQGSRERLRHVGFALIDPARSQPLILAVAEVQVGEMNEAQKPDDLETLTFWADGSWPASALSKF
jgi:hypothetical protein